MKHSLSDTAKFTLVADAFVFVPVFVMFCIVKSALTWHFGEFSFFSWNAVFFSDCLRTPGGLSEWLGCLLSQFCSVPPLGAALAALLAVVSRHLVFRLLRTCAKSALFLSAVPAFLLTLFICAQDYSVYVLKEAGLFFSQSIGLVLGLILCLASRSLSERKYGVAVAVILYIAAYPLIGFYSMFAASLSAVCLSRTRPLRGLLLLAVSAVPPFVAAISGNLYPAVNPDMMFLTGLPYRDFVGNWILYLPLAGALVFTLLCPVLPADTPSWLEAAAAAAGLCCLVAFTNYDRNLSLQLDMERAMAGGDWARVLDDASKARTPARPLVLYRNIALYQRGELCESMFEYPDGYTPLATRADIPVSIVCSADAYYYTGLLNYAERWATELSVTYSKNVHLMKILAKVAVLTGDGPLARKYLDLVGGVLFQKRWARRYSDLTGDPDAVSADPEFSRIIPLVNASGDRRFISGDVAETVILHHFASSVPCNEEIYEWKMASLMTLKREADFMDTFFRYNDSYSCPKGIAQAAVLFGANSGDRQMYLKTFEILGSEKQMLSEFSSFARSYNSAPDVLTDSALARYRRNYGTTYWYYYYFVNDIKTN